ncbi:MAG TPA: helix-turn-helix domain-containing protein [Pseudonocardiaceae bacterium]|nr:helix-turn-helix domain-containing protein [Pseudonocardiaceae bacterium]
MARIDTTEPLDGDALDPLQAAKPRPCPIAASLKVIGERWTLLAVRELSYGVHRFDQIAAYTGATRDILAERLRKLEAAGVVERRQYSEHPPRFEYYLTAAGEELYPTLRSLAEWGDRWAMDEPSVAYRHQCGHRVQVDHLCRHCGEPVTNETVELVPIRR